MLIANVYRGKMGYFEARNPKKYSSCKTDKRGEIDELKVVLYLAIVVEI